MRNVKWILALLVLTCSVPVFSEAPGGGSVSFGEPGVKYRYYTRLREEYVDTYDTVNTETQTWSKKLSAETEEALNSKVEATISIYEGTGVSSSVGVTITTSIGYEVTISFSRVRDIRIHRTVYDVYRDYYTIMTLIETGESWTSLTKSVYVRSKIVDRPY